MTGGDRVQRLGMEEAEAESWPAFGHVLGCSTNTGPAAPDEAVWNSLVLSPSEE